MSDINADQVATVEEKLEDALQSVEQLSEENRALQLKVLLLSKLLDNVDVKILDLAEENSYLRSCIEFREKKFREHCEELRDTMYTNKLQKTITENVNSHLKRKEYPSKIEKPHEACAQAAINRVEKACSLRFDDLKEEHRCQLEEA